MAGSDEDEDGIRLWESLMRQTGLTAQLCTIMRDVKGVRGGTQKKIEKLRQLLSGLHSELTYFEEVSVTLPLFIFSLNMTTGCDLVEVLTLPFLLVLVPTANSFTSSTGCSHYWDCASRVINFQKCIESSSSDISNSYWWTL